jgi:hypothetical protein
MERLKLISFLILLVIVVALYGLSLRLKKTFKRESALGLERTGTLSSDIITEKDLQHLPQIVSKYLHYAGVVGNKKVNNMRVVLEGRIRSNPESGWMKLTSVQYNFFDIPTRVFYIKASKVGIPAIGLHLYKNGKATFMVKILGLLKVVDAKGEKLDQAETVTVLNDMCLLAPATLISEKIQWEVIDSLSVNATFTNDHITISAELVFNEKGELINFISNDRYETDGKKYNNYPWLTPVKEYKELNGFRFCAEVSTDYQRTDTTFSYGEFRIKEVEYNCKELE